MPCDKDCYKQWKECDCYIDIYDYSNRVEGTLSFLANLLMVLMTILFLIALFNIV